MKNRKTTSLKKNCNLSKNVWFSFSDCFTWFIIWSAPFTSAWVKSPIEKQRLKKEGTTNFLFLLLCWRRGNKLCLAVVLKKKRKLFLSIVRGWIFPWHLSRKLITWAKRVSLTILAKTTKTIEKYFPLAKSNLVKVPSRTQGISRLLFS